MAENSAPSPVPLAHVLATVFLPFAGGYFLSYLFRSVNAVIAPNLTRDVGLGAADLGLLTSAYFLSFAAFQVPLGVLLDRFGPRRVQAALLLSAALGALVFATGASLAQLALGRLLIGLGVAGGLMASFKAITLWFARERWPLVNGAFMACGGLGALVATAPVEAALHVTDWRGVFVALAAMTVVVAGTIFLAVPEARSAAAAPRLAEQIRGLGLIFGDRLFRRLAPISLMTMGSGMAIQGLWAGPYLHDVGGLDRDGVAGHLLVLALFLTVGFVGTGLVADILVRRGFRLIDVFAGGATLYLVALVLLALGIDADGYWPMAAIGLLSNATVLAFPILSQHFPVAYTGRANTALNLVVFGAAFVLQYAIGWVIDLWPAGAGGAYPPLAYSVAFGAIAALTLLGLLRFVAAGRRHPPN